MNREPATTTGGEPRDTEVGSVFVSNYPPYSFWGSESLPRVDEVLDAPPRPGVPLGLYVHVPFCRRRCKFCYFKVYTDKTGAQVREYLEALVRELELYAGKPALAGRPLRFVYFGGGTPSFLGARQLRGLVPRMRQALGWDGVEEVTFECEPGTLTRPKLEALRELGITRLSLGVENFDDTILRENGRAHVSKEIYRVVPWIRALDFDQLNVDLIAGMVGESWTSWKDTVRRTVEMEPDSVTIYQLELPFNTVYSRGLLQGNGLSLADWQTKREWHAYAFEQLEASGYEVSSAYTMVKRRPQAARFVYRDSVWRGCDLLGTGVSSFSHLGGLHYQNVSGWEPYVEQLAAGRLPLDRAFAPNPDEQLTREMILQLKLGRLQAGYFREKFGVEILRRFRSTFEGLEARNMLILGRDEVHLTRQGLLRVDSLLSEFYATRYQNSRYT